MPNVSYVFTVNPGRNNRYTVPHNNFEIKAISAVDMEVSVVDARGTAPIEAFITGPDVHLSVSVIIGQNNSLQFHNPAVGRKNGYFGAVT